LLLKQKEIMPITKYTPANLKKLKKDELRWHVMDLYEFIDLFDFHKLTEENEKLQEEIKKLQKDNGYLLDIKEQNEEIIDFQKEENENRSILSKDEVRELLRISEHRLKQIPDKKGKKLSQRDKACLYCVRDILGSFSDDDKMSDDPVEDDWYDDETLKLLDRLLK